MFNFFSKTNNTDVVCSINFSLKKDRNISTELYWPNFDKTSDFSIKQIALDFAGLLHLLMSGDMKQDLDEMLTKLQLKDQSAQDKKFLHYLCSHLLYLYWSTSSSQNKNSLPDEPLISPTKVFKNINVK